jgi:hypothetical protein
MLLSVHVGNNTGTNLDNLQSCLVVALPRDFDHFHQMLHQMLTLRTYIRARIRPWTEPFGISFIPSRSTAENNYAIELLLEKEAYQCPSCPTMGGCKGCSRCW